MNGFVNNRIRKTNRFLKYKFTSYIGTSSFHLMMLLDCDGQFFHFISYGVNVALFVSTLPVLNTSSDHYL
jgi:hypothetical protein